MKACCMMMMVVLLGSGYVMMLLLLLVVMMATATGGVVRTITATTAPVTIFLFLYSLFEVHLGVAFLLI